MVGNDISSSCYPTKVKIGKELSNGTLILNVVHGKEMEIEYSKKKIIDKINLFFGYSYISEIKLMVIQNKVKLKKSNSNVNYVNNKFEKPLSKIKNIELKSSLDKLINAFHRKK